MSVIAMRVSVISGVPDEIFILDRPVRAAQLPTANVQSDLKWCNSLKWNGRHIRVKLELDIKRPGARANLS